MFLNSISQGPRGPLGWGRGPASEAAHKGATSLLETRRKRSCLRLKIDAGPMVFWPRHPARPWNMVILLWGEPPPPPPPHKGEAALLTSSSCFFIHVVVSSLQVPQAAPGVE